MSELPRGNPRIPEGINARNEKPLVEFLQLLAGVLVGIATLVLVIVLVIDLTAPYIPFSWEQKAAPLVAQYLDDGGDPADPAAAQALAQLGAQLVHTSAALDAEARASTGLVPADQYQFHLMNSEIANAFATLGGHIIVTSALLQQVQSENGLAMVVAHEIAHIRYRHPIAGASRALVLQLALYALLGGTGDGPIAGLLSGSSMLALLSFNRDMEAQADARALDIIDRHYGTYRGADEFFRSMAASDNAALWLEFAQTHPNTGRRLDVINGRLQAAGGGAGTVTPLPAPLQFIQQGGQTCVNAHGTDPGNAGSTSAQPGAALSCDSLTLGIEKT